jgi:hypothetical protein
MGTVLRRLRLLVVALAAVVIAFSASSGAPAWADGPCANGHNWDDVRKICV